MDAALQPMLDVARQALANAHAPYSRFRVGACLRAASGRLYGGCNVENAAYPVGQCAEATAIGAMVAAGDHEIVEVVVVTEGREICSAVRPLPPAARRVRAAGRARPPRRPRGRAASRPRSASSCRSRSVARPSARGGPTARPGPEALGRSPSPVSRRRRS